MQTCSICQYESPVSAKFCRQCGAPLVTESEFSSASTRNYGRQEPALAVSSPLPPSIGDVIGADTARQYHQPPVYTPPVVSTAPIKGSSFSFPGWRYFPALIALLIGLTLGVAMTTGLGDERPTPLTPAQQAALDAADAQQAYNEDLANKFRDSQNRLQEIQALIQEAQERAREATAQAAENGVPIPGDIKPLNLDAYEYPNASLGNYSRIPGAEMVQLKTKDSFDAITQFYQKKLGKPLLLIKDEDDNSAIFQSPTGQPSAPGVFVSVENDDENDGFWRITITRAPTLFPQIEVPPAPPAPPPAPPSASAKQ